MLFILLMSRILGLNFFTILLYIQRERLPQVLFDSDYAYSGIGVFCGNH